MYTRNCELKPGYVFPEGMQRIALGVEYNGSEFHGFQQQKTTPKTVQAELHAALSSIADEDISVVCAGRTDAGVHASGQVVHFDTLAVRPDRAWFLGANARLPRGVSINWALPVSPHFHARFSALARTYRYVIHNNGVRSALATNLVTWQKRPMDYEKLLAAAGVLIGEHDFSAFRAAQCQAKNPVREIRRIRFCRYKDLIVLEVTANAFLHHMVRNLVGSLFAVSCGDKPVSWIQEILHCRDRNRAAATAPSAGLYLVGVEYPAALNLPVPTSGPWFLPEKLTWDEAQPAGIHERLPETR